METLTNKVALNQGGFSREKYVESVKISLPNNRRVEKVHGPSVASLVLVLSMFSGFVPLITEKKRNSQW